MRLKNKILKAVTACSVLAFFVAGSALDSESFLPHGVIVASLVWIILFCYANGYFKEGEK